MALKAAGVECKMLQNLDDSWSLRFGPMTTHDAGRAVTAFVR